MFIKELKLTNFKSFNGIINPIKFHIPNGEPGSGLNIFVGENNTGKSTTFEAIDFVRNGTKKDTSDIKNKNNPLEAKVEITFSGNIDQTITGFSQPNKAAVFKKYIFSDSDGNDHFKISRDTKDIKQIKLWDNSEELYKNESGIDAPIKKLFETNFVWADTNPNNEAAFGSTTLCGNLLKEIIESFTETKDYKDFRDKFNAVFNNQDSVLRKSLITIEKRVQAIFKEQFGSADITFHFDELKIESFFKNTTIKVNDGIETPMHEKGNGMQRAVVLALLQVYAEELVKHPSDTNLLKPFFLFIDEPEICLHPKGQEKLLNALVEISRTKQVFITTHSPYFLTNHTLKNVGLYIFKKVENSSVIESPSVSPLFPWSPTWGEINFNAYNLATVEFHNELYGYLQDKNTVYTERDFEVWIKSKITPSLRSWTPEKAGKSQASRTVSLQTFIRNKIHHPENSTMQHIEFTPDELKESISQMISIL